MRQKFLLTSALALSGLLASCDDGRYLVGILGPGPNPSMPGAGGAAGMAGMGGGAGGNGMMPGQPPPYTPPPPSLCAQVTPPLPARPLGISTAQVAERLARFIFASRAEPDLLMRASVLRNSTEVQQLARTMLAETRAHAGVRALSHQWLGLDAVRTATGASTISSEITPDLRSAMLAETDRFVDHVFLEGDGRLHTLLTASYTFMDQRLAPLYGVMHSSPVPTQVMLDPSQRSGLLTHPGLLFANPRATSRGFWLNKQLLCQEIPPAPAGISQPDLDLPVPMKSARQRLEESLAEPACTACHRVMDGPGYAFEHFDALGRWRDTDNGVPVNSSGSLTSLPQGGGYMFNGAGQLGASLAVDCSVQACATQVFLQQALGGHLRPSDQQSVRNIWSDFARSDFNLRELIVAITGSEVFLAP